MPHYLVSLSLSLSLSKKGSSHIRLADVGRHYAPPALPFVRVKTPNISTARLLVMSLPSQSDKDHHGDFKLYSACLITFVAPFYRRLVHIILSPIYCIPQHPHLSPGTAILRCVPIKNGRLANEKVGISHQHCVPLVL